jgi:hypothetical protein
VVKEDDIPYIRSKNGVIIEMDGVVDIVGSKD